MNRFIVLTDATSGSEGIFSLDFIKALTEDLEGEGTIVQLGDGSLIIVEETYEELKAKLVWEVH